MTSICKLDERTGQMRIRNLSGEDQPFLLFQVSGDFELAGVATIGDSIWTVPWRASNNIFALQISSYEIRKAIDDNPICESDPTETSSMTTTATHTPS
jgi:hypothetical protein